jgi:hypothetical protein
VPDITAWTDRAAACMPRLLYFRGELPEPVLNPLSPKGLPPSLPPCTSRDSQI